jgi:hypothetical protein
MAFVNWPARDVGLHDESTKGTAMIYSQAASLGVVIMFVTLALTAWRR